MHREDQKIPFDVSLFRSLPFELSEPKHLKAARGGLKDLVAAALDGGHRVENPVTKARGQVVFEQNATPADVIIRDQVEALTAAVSQVQERLSYMVKDPLGLYTVPALRTGGPFYGGGPILEDGGTLLNLMFRDANRTDTNVLFEFLENKIAPVLGGYHLIENNTNNLLIRVGTDGISEPILKNFSASAKAAGVLIRLS
jgi:hypothetical protein